MRMLRFVIACYLFAVTFAAPSPVQPEQTSLFQEAYNIYTSCSGQDLTVCLKLKALGYVDRAARSNEIEIVDGFKIIKNEDARDRRSENGRSLNDIEASLPADSEAKETAVDEALYERAARFLSTHTIELSYPEETGRAHSESRLLKKKKGIGKMILPLILMMKAKMLLLAPLLLGGLILLSLKALVIGKIALAISAILAFQKLMSNKNQGYEQNYIHPAPHEEHHDHHAWARSLETAYRGQKPENA